MIDASQFKREEDFKTWFLSEPDPKTQLEGLKAWRQHQQQVVASLPNLVRLLASDQYTHSDHFLLELLQNADDNDFAVGETPSLTITLDDTSCTFECNEIGFTPENVFAICYAAASTKKRRLTGRTFIGEKGIGFKSIFAVAQAVEIHSGDYHFELRDQEFVIPHLLGGDRIEGSRIVVRFKPDFPDLPTEVSMRLRLLSEDSRHFLIFLQQLESLNVVDQLRDTERRVQVVRDPITQRCLVESDDDTVEYLVQSFPVEVPAEIVKSRFDELNEPLTREVLFAVPLPEDLEKVENLSGRLFCYLPTQQTTGMPIHIQLDAKTVTNREDITDASTTPWNRFMLDRTTELLEVLFKQLQARKEFSEHLPKYLPPNPLEVATANQGLKKCIQGFCSKMKNAEWVLDRHGDFRRPALVRHCQKPMTQWTVSDQYEKHLRPFGISTPGEKDDATFLAAKWGSFVDVISKYGCGELSHLDHRDLWKLGGVPQMVKNGDETIQRNFLTSVIKFCNKEVASSWKVSPIFPLRTNKESFWGEIDGKVLLLVAETQNPSIPDDVTIIEPSFTMVPTGSGKQVDDVREFNNLFRDFMASTLEVKRYSDATYLEEIVIKGMQDPSEIVGKQSVLEWSVRWVELYYRVWRRKKTLQDESAKQWESLIAAIGKCQIPVRQKAPDESRSTVEVGKVFLPCELWSIRDIEAEYVSIGAPIADLLIDEATEEYWKGQARRRESEIDRDDWGAFLREVGAKPGPFVTSVKISPPTPMPTIYGVDFFCDELNERITGSDRKAFRFYPIDSIRLDIHTATLISRPEIPESLTRALAGLWPTIGSSVITVGYDFGSVKSKESVTLPLSLASVQMSGRPFKVITTEGELRRADDCYLDTPENVVLALGVLPLVRSSNYGSDPKFLVAIGVKGEITTEGLEKTIRGMFDGGRHLHSANVFGPFLQLAARMAARNKQDRIWLGSTRIFLDALADELLDYRSWKSRGADEQFDEATRDSIEAAFGTNDESLSPEELIQLLESIHDLGTSRDLVTTWLLRVARVLHREDGAQVVGLFAESLARGGSTCLGAVVTELNLLPLIWDRSPLPESTSGILLPPDRPDEAAAIIEAAIRLGWPVLSRRSSAVRAPSPMELERKEWRLLHRVVEELSKMFERSNPHAARRLASMPFAKGIGLAEGAIRPVKEIHIEVDGIEGSFTVPYWRNGEGIHAAIDGTDLIAVIADLIDTECQVTVAPFIGMIREKVEPEVLEYEGDDIDPAGTPPSGGVGGSGPKVGTGSSSAEELLLGGGDENGGSPENNGGANPGGSNRDDTRKRLCSLTTPGKGGGNGTTNRSTAARDELRNKETEEAGAKVLKEFFHHRGLTAVSVESLNCGYDFEVSIGTKKLCIELKTSRAKWRGWEHSLSPNEFKTALRVQDDYFLCVVDRVFESSREIHFIRNPAGKITDYLFDAPWKNVSSNMVDMVGALKATEGVLDD